jgi:hypothetical protein
MPVRISALMKSLGIVVLAVATTPLLSAKAVIVDCSGATPGAFTSLEAALQQLPLQEPDDITITGTCVERAGISGFNQLTVHASGTAIINVSAPHVDAVDIADSRVTILGPLVVEGAGIGITEHSDVILDEVTVHHSPQNGVFVSDSILRIADGTIQDSTANGMYVQDSHAFITGETVTNSHQAGIFVRHGHVEVRTFSVPVPPRATVVNNNSVGLWLTEGSQGDLIGFNHGGTNVGENFSGNTGDGILVEDTSVLASQGNDSISNNGGDGVQLKGMALAHWLAPETITGNGGFSLHCDNTSLVEADVSALKHMSCARIAPR